MLLHRQGNILKDESPTVNKPAWAANFTVTALPVGGVARLASNGTTTGFVDLNHGFKATDKVLIFDNNTATFINDPIASVTNNTIVWTTATPTYSKYALFCNLGPDPGTGGTPDYDSSPMYIWEDSDGADTPLTNSLVTCDGDGNYDYWTAGDGRSWELIRDTNGDVQGVIPGWGGVAGRLNPCDYGCIPDSTGDNGTDNQARMQVAANAAAWSGLVFHGPPGNFAMESQLLLKANFTAINDPRFKLVKRWDTVASTQAAMVVSEDFATAAPGAGISDDNIWWQGGRMTVGAADTYGGSMFGIWSDYGMIKDIIIEEWGSNAAGGFAGFLMGNYGWITDSQAYSTITTPGGSDGFGRNSGKGGGMTNCRVKSADDCYTTSVWYGGPNQDVACTDMVVANCHGQSTGDGARVFHIGTATGGPTTANVERIHVSNLTGSAVGPAVTMQISNAADTGSIKNVTIDGVSVVSASGGDVWRAVFVDGSFGAGSYQCEDIHIRNLRSTATSNVAPQQGIIRFDQVNRGSFANSTIDASGASINLDEVVFLFDCKGVDVLDNHFKCYTSAAATELRVIQAGSGVTGSVGGVIRGNTITDLPQNGIGIALDEGSQYVVTGNRVKIAAGVTTGVVGIRDLGGTTEGHNIITDNDLSDWLALEAADHAALNSPITNDAIQQLNEGDSVYANNIGHDLVGVELYNADATPAQGEVPLRARISQVTPALEDESVTMPYAVQGRRITIYNTAALDLQIFPAKGDNIGDGVDDPMFLAGIAHVELFALNKVNWIVTSGTLKSTSA